MAAAADAAAQARRATAARRAMGSPAALSSGLTVVVVGAGIVGVSTALWLQRGGHRVVLIDRSGPGEGASFGNGGVLASCAVVPVTGPGLPRSIPGLLIRRDSPLFLRWSYAPRLAPWL